MSIVVNDNGTLRRIRSAFVNDNGTLRRLHTAAINDNGTLRLARIAKVTLSGGSPSGLSTAQVILRSDGTVDFNADGSIFQVSTATDWVIPNSAAPGSYVVRATHSSGDLPAGTFNSWLALTSDRAWGFVSAVTAASGVILLEISSDGGSTVLDSAQYTISVTG